MAASYNQSRFAFPLARPVRERKGQKLFRILQTLFTIFFRSFSEADTKVRSGINTSEPAPETDATNRSLSKNQTLRTEVQNLVNFFTGGQRARLPAGRLSVTLKAEPKFKL